MFLPGGASLLKNNSPTEHTAGKDVPNFKGLVDAEFVKSTAFA
jgi:hypothetical protein